jgi:rubrerythrin
MTTRDDQIQIELDSSSAEDNVASGKTAAADRAASDSSEKISERLESMNERFSVLMKKMYDVFVQQVQRRDKGDETMPDKEVTKMLGTLMGQIKSMKEDIASKAQQRWEEGIVWAI